MGRPAFAFPLFRLFLFASFAFLTCSASPAWGGKVTVWADDAHTRRITVSELDPDEVADKTRLSLGLGASLGNFGISIGWSREQGIAFTEKVEELIEKIRDLCEEFNDGDLSLETYQRRMRGIFEAEEQARQFRLELMTQIAMDSRRKAAEMDEALGSSVKGADAYRSGIEEAMNAFAAGVDALPHRKQAEEPAAQAQPKEPEPQIVTILEDAGAQSLQAVTERLQAFERSVEAEPPPPPRLKERITIFKDRARTEKITVAKLDCEKIVHDVQESLSLGARYSGYCLDFSVGPVSTWMLRCAARYDEAAQMLILKYRELCLEFNAGVVSLEEYADRLEALIAAEKKAQETRDNLHEYLKEQAMAEMDRLSASRGAMGGFPDSSAMDALAGEMRAGAKEETGRKAPPSLVESMSRDHRALIQKSLDDFSASAQETGGSLGDEGDKIEVWKDEAHTDKVRVSRLDTDLIAQTTRTRLSLHITWFNFGPEFSWAKKKGLDYGQAAQRLIVRLKQLCMDFNAGLLSLEGFQNDRAEIEQAVEKASQVRERMQLYMQALKQGSLEEMDSFFK